MRQLKTVLFISALGALLLTGCQESDSSQIRRARLIATENMQLKQDLKERNQQIEDLKTEIEKIETESAEAIERAGETSIKSMRLLLESDRNPIPLDWPVA